MPATPSRRSGRDVIAGILMAAMTASMSGGLREAHVGALGREIDGGARDARHGGDGLFHPATQEAQVMPSIASVTLWPV